jgi:hypothetical protein
MGGYVSDTLLISIGSTLEPFTPEIARTLGEPEQHISRGVELATATVLGALSLKTVDPDALRQVVALAQAMPADAVLSALSSGQLNNLNSPLHTGGARFLLSLLGTVQPAIFMWVSRESGLRTRATAAVFALAAQSVLSRIGMLVRDEGMTAIGVLGFLHSAAASLQGYLPAGFYRAFSTTSPGTRGYCPVVPREIETNSIVAQTVRRERSLVPKVVAVLIIVIGVLWFLLR